TREYAFSVVRFAAKGKKKLQVWLTRRADQGSRRQRQETRWKAAMRICEELGLASSAAVAEVDSTRYSTSASSRPTNLMLPTACTLSPAPVSADERFRQD